MTKRYNWHSWHNLPNGLHVRTDDELHLRQPVEGVALQHLDIPRWQSADPMTRLASHVLATVVADLANRHVIAIFALLDQLDRVKDELRALVATVQNLGGLHSRTRKHLDKLTKMDFTVLKNDVQRSLAASQI